MALRVLSSLLLLLLTALITAADASDLQSDRSALLPFRASFSPLLNDWNISHSPCSWTGVLCSSHRVTGLHLPSAGLIGPIPPATIGNLTALIALSLRYNALSGPFPDIAAATHLRLLNLEGNNLTGEIPPTLYMLQNLEQVNLASNGFTGRISPALNNLTRLRALYVDRNNLSGQIPDLNLPVLTHINLSYNQFTGSIPASLRNWPSSAFLSMPLCGGPLPTCPGEISPGPAKDPQM